MFSKKLSHIAVALIPFALVGCSEYSEAEINQFTADQLNRDKQINYDLTRAIQKIDSTVMGTDFTINDKGERVVEIHRSTDSGMVVTSELSKEDSDKLIQAVESKTQSSNQEATSSPSTGETFMAGAGGAITGMLLGQMLMNSMNTTRSANSFSTYRSQNRSVYSSSVANTTRAKAASGGFSGSSRSGSFSSSGGRSMSAGG